MHKIRFDERSTNLGFKISFKQDLKLKFEQPQIIFLFKILEIIQIYLIIYFNLEFNASGL